MVLEKFISCTSSFLKNGTTPNKLEITLVNTFGILFVGCFFNDPFDRLVTSSNFQLVHA